MFQEAGGDLRFLAQASWREHVGIGDLVIAVFKVALLEPAFVSQRPDAVVGLTHADPHFSRQVPLTDVGLLFDQLEELVGDFFTHR